MHTVRDGIDPGNLRVLSQFVGVVEIWKSSDSRITLYPPRVLRDLDVGQGGSSSRALAA